MVTLTTGIIVLDPTVGPSVEGATRASRPKTLKGLRVGFIDNSKRNSDQILKILDEMLRERFQTGASVHLRKPTASRVVQPEMVNQLLKQCDVVIPGVGD